MLRVVHGRRLQQEWRHPQRLHHRPPWRRWRGCDVVCRGRGHLHCVSEARKMTGFAVRRRWPDVRPTFANVCLPTKKSRRNPCRRLRGISHPRNMSPRYLRDISEKAQPLLKVVHDQRHLCSRLSLREIFEMADTVPQRTAISRRNCSHEHFSVLIADSGPQWSVSLRICCLK